MPDNQLSSNPLHLVDDLGFTDSAISELNDAELTDLLEERLEEVGASPEQCETTRNAVAIALLEKYHAEDIEYHGEDSYDDSEGRERYVTIKPFVATKTELRKAARKPDILRGIATNKFGVLAAAPGTGKSMLALAMCAAVASGKEVLGFQPHCKDGLDALFVSLEEESDEILLRWQALNQVYEFETEERLHIAGENNIKFHTAGGAEEFVTGAVLDLAELITQTQAKFVVLDPLSQWRLGNEDNATFSLFSSAIKQLCTHCDSTIMVIHHIRKPPAGFLSESHNADAIRGASDLRAAARFILLLDYETKIAPGVISLCFDKVQYGKSKWKLPPMCMSEEIVETDTGNYATGVLVKYVPEYELPMSLPEVEAYKEALLLAYEDTEHYRSDVRSPQWLGVVLAEYMDVDIGAGIASKERTNEQQTAFNKIKTDLNRLVNLQMITRTQQEIDKGNRQTKQVHTYIRGMKL